MIDLNTIMAAVGTAIEGLAPSISAPTSQASINSSGSASFAFAATAGQFYVMALSGVDGADDINVTDTVGWMNNIQGLAGAYSAGSANSVMFWGSVPADASGTVTITSASTASLYGGMYSLTGCSGANTANVYHGTSLSVPMNAAKSSLVISVATDCGGTVNPNITGPGTSSLFNAGITADGYGAANFELLNSDPTWVWTEDSPANPAVVAAEFLSELVPGIRVYPYPPDQTQPPCAVVSWPTQVLYDETFHDGTDLLELPVHIIIGKASDRSSALQLGPYLSTSGTSSIKAAIETDPTLGRAVSSTRVTDATVSVMSLGGIDYLAATITLQIYT